MGGIILAFVSLESLLLCISLSCTSSTTDALQDQYAIPLHGGMAVDQVNVESYAVKNGESNLLLWQTDNPIIQVYSLSDSTYTDSISLRQWNVVDIAGIDVDAGNSVFHILAQGGRLLLSIGFDGSLIDKKSIPSPRDSTSTEYEVYPPFFVSGEKLYCTVGAALEPNQFVKKPAFARLDFTSGSWQPIAWQPKKVQANSNFGFYYFNFTLVDREKQLFCLQSPVEDSVRIFKDANLERVQSVDEFQSEFIPRPQDKRAGADVIFETTNPFYTGVFYLSRDNTIITVRADRQPIRDSSGLFNSLYLRPFTVGVVNMDRDGHVSLRRYGKKNYLFNPRPFLIKNSMFGRLKTSTNPSADTLFIGRIT